MTFDELGLEARLLKSVHAMGYSEPTPIQQDAIPLALAGRDVVGCAQTGTGKTAAFVLPALQRLSHAPGIKALVVTPTRELALQIEEVARVAARFTGHRVLCVYGGVGYEPQVAALRKGVDFLVATPGRLLDVCRRGDANLGHVEILVLDEADRMLDMGFWPDVRRILALLPEKRQNLLFSATMSDEVLRVVASTLDDPVRVDVGQVATPVDAVRQAVYAVDAAQKAELLVELVRRQDLTRVLVFVRTRHRADRVARVLVRNDIECSVIHSDRTQAQRQKALEGFKDGRVRVLVATDIVARGIDVESISHVVNFDIPANPEDYVHRVGRTARAGATGTAISFLAAEEVPDLEQIERFIGMTIACEDLPGFTYKERFVPPADRTPMQKKPRVVYGGRVMGRRRRGRR
ncbi:MAG: DEAD/DEAH box helicase [Coriobacteriia bacterium]